MISPPPPIWVGGQVGELRRGRDRPGRPGTGAAQGGDLVKNKLC